MNLRFNVAYPADQQAAFNAARDQLAAGTGLSLADCEWVLGAWAPDSWPVLLDLLAEGMATITREATGLRITFGPRIDQDAPVVL